MFELVIHATLVLVAQTAGLPGKSAPESPREIGTLVSTLESGDASDAEREQARARLREIAAGPPSDRRTRAAVFALVSSLPAEDPIGERVSIEILLAAASLYPDDPRTGDVLRRLGLAQIASGDRYGAHYSLTRLFGHPKLDIDAEMRVAAATNAAAVGDMVSALEWSKPLDPETLTEELRTELWRIRLSAAESVGRHSEALVASERLDELAPDRLRSDPVALLAAARTDAAVGRLESAEVRYAAFLNIHTRSTDRADVMLEHAKLLGVLQRPLAARQSFDWVLKDYPDSPQADMARIERIDLDPTRAALNRADAYRRAADNARTAAASDEACKRVMEILIADGRPLEAISILAWMIHNSPGLAGLAARKNLMHGLEPAMNLLVAREDTVGLAAASAIASSVNLPLPVDLRPTVANARRDLGITVRPGALEQARRHELSGDWDQIRPTLQTLPPTAALRPGLAAEVARLSAESLWRDGLSDQALEDLDRAIGSDGLSPAMSRRMRVLRADILLSTGRKQKACADYLAAAEVRPSVWVASRLEQCPK